VWPGVSWTTVCLDSLSHSSLKAAGLNSSFSSISSPAAFACVEDIQLTFGGTSVVWGCSSAGLVGVRGGWERQRRVREHPFFGLWLNFTMKMHRQHFYGLVPSVE